MAERMVGVGDIVDIHGESRLILAIQAAPGGGAVVVHEAAKAI